MRTSAALNQCDDATLANIVTTSRRPRQRDEAFECLLARHRDLVLAVVATRRRPVGISRDDIFQIGAIALLEAANKYDPERGVPFRPFASTLIRQRVIDEARVSWERINVGRRTAARVRDGDIEGWVRIQAAWALEPAIELDREHVSDEGNGVVTDLLIADDDVEGGVVAREERAQLHASVASAESWLDPRVWDRFQRVYPLDGSEPEQATDVARTDGVTDSAVSISLRRARDVVAQRIAGREAIDRCYENRSAA